MSSLMKNADRVLGWSLAGVLALTFSIRAGALDLDQEIKRHNQTSSEIGLTLGRDRGGLKPVKNQELPSLDADDLEDDYKVELIPVKRDKSS